MPYAHMVVMPGGRSLSREAYRRLRAAAAAADSLAAVDRRLRDLPQRKVRTRARLAEQKRRRAAVLEDRLKAVDDKLKAAVGDGTRQLVAEARSGGDHVVLFWSKGRVTVKPIAFFRRPGDDELPRLGRAADALLLAAGYETPPPADWTGAADPTRRRRMQAKGLDLLFRGTMPLDRQVLLGPQVPARTRAFRELVASRPRRAAVERARIRAFADLFERASDKMPRVRRVDGSGDRTVRPAGRKRLSPYELHSRATGRPSKRVRTAARILGSMRTTNPGC